MKLILAVTILMFAAGCSDAPNEAQQPPQDSTTQANAPETGNTPDTAPAPAAHQDTAPAGDSRVDALTSGLNLDKSDPAWKLSLPKPEVLQFAEGDEVYWHLSTNLGDMTFRLFSDVAPMHATSTLYLTHLGFYDNVIFHRIIPGFMAQGGDPLGKGMGGPGYEYDGEFRDTVKHDRPGLLSMANRGPGTDGSQFFITFVATPWLDGKHTIFGEMIEGQEVLAAIEQRGSRSGATSEEIIIQHATYEWQSFDPTPAS